jgi:hypothetical protein
MAPVAAHNGWYYITQYLDVAPGIGAGPVVTGLKVAKYVAIKSSRIGTLWGSHVFPNMKNFTQF